MKGNIQTVRIAIPKIVDTKLRWMNKSIHEITKYPIFLRQEGLLAII